MNEGESKIGRRHRLARHEMIFYRCEKSSFECRVDK